MAIKFLSSENVQGNIDVVLSQNAITYLAVSNVNTGVSANARVQVVGESAQFDIIASSAGYTGVAGWADAGIISTDSGASGGLILNSVGGIVKIQTAQTTALSFDSSQIASFTEDVNIADGKKLHFGAASPSGDLRIYHVADSNSYIEEHGAGALVFKSNDYYFQSTASATVLQVIPGAGIITTGYGTFSGIITGQSSSSGDYVRMYGSSGTAQWDIYGNGENLRLSENSGGGGLLAVDSGATFGGDVTVPRIGIVSLNASYNLYNDGTTYLNGAVTIDNSLTISAATSGLYIGSSRIFLSSTGDLAISSVGGDLDITTWLRIRSGDAGTIRFAVSSVQGSTHIGGDADQNYALKSSLTLPSTFAGDVQVSKNVYQIESSGATRGLYSMRPWGGDYFTQTSSITGYLKIKLPVTTNVDDMIKFTVDIYLYGGNTALTAHLGGYLTSSLGWGNTTATIVAGEVAQNYTVRFGNDGTNYCVYIGESDTTWSYPQVIIRDFFAGYGAVSTDVYVDEWVIDFTASTGTISQTLTNNFPLSSGGTDDAYWTGSGNDIYNDNSANVGIGITVPVTKLHLSGYTAASASTSSNNGIFTLQSTNGVQLQMGSYASSPYGYWIQTKDANNAGPYNYPLILQPVNGNVGINETTPTATLQVNGDIKIGSGAGSGTDSNNMSIQVSNATYGDTANLGLLVRNNGTNGQFAQIGFGYSESKCPVVIGSVTTSGSSATKGDFVIGTRSTTTGSDAPTERMRIDSSGNVGIGTSTPSYPLDVVASVNADWITEFKNTNTAGNTYGVVINTLAGAGTYNLGCYTHTGNGFFVKNNGTVGIGTTSPDSVLEVVGPTTKTNLGTVSNQTITCSGGGGVGEYNQIGFGYTAGDFSPGVIGYVTTNGAVSTLGALIFATRNSTTASAPTERMRIQSDGNVLIGTTGATNTRLKVATTTASEWACQITHSGTTPYGLAIDCANNAGVYALGVYTNTGTGLFVKNDGKVGIGTASPGVKLQVQHDQAAESNVIFMNNSTSAGAAIRLTLNVGNPAGDDPMISFNIGDGGLDWTMGVDNSDSDKFKISGGTDSHNPNLGTNDQLVIDSSGNLTMTGDVIAYSDKKLKKNIKTLDGSKVYKMRGVSFDRIDTGESSSGVIAQEIQKIAPELISESNETLGVAYGNISGYLIEAIKELKAEIEELKKNR